jgi:hypothetical protein
VADRQKGSGVIPINISIASLNPTICDQIEANNRFTIRIFALRKVQNNQLVRHPTIYLGLDTSMPLVGVIKLVRYGPAYFVPRLAQNA